MKKTLISTILATALISTMIATVANASVTEDNILINLNSSVETNIEEIDYASMISSIQLPVLVENLKTYMVYFILNLCAKFSLKSQPSIYGKYGKWIL